MHCKELNNKKEKKWTVGGHPGKVWLALSLDNTKLEKQSSAVLPNHIHVGTNEQTSSARFSINIPKRKSCMFWRPVYATTKPTVCVLCTVTVLCHGKTAVGLFSVRWRVALNGDNMKMVECGHRAKAQKTASAGVQVVLLHRSSPFLSLPGP